jgi:hypothetical protein
MNTAGTQPTLLDAATTAAAPRSPGPARTLFDLLRHRGFALAAGVLLFAAVGFNLAAALLDLSFNKEHLPMRQAFDKAVPRIISGKWVLGLYEEPNEGDLEFLGTKDYLFCRYVNAEMLGLNPDELLRRLESCVGHEARRRELGAVLSKNPLAEVKVRLTYYGRPDTVAHVPERCYPGNGFIAAETGTEDWVLKDGRKLDLRCLTFEQTLENDAKISTFVSYIFHCDGIYTSDSLVVRALLHDLSTRYGYYSKIELESMFPDRKAVRGVMAEFLADALPSIEQALPDWDQWKSRKD